MNKDCKVTLEESPPVAILHVEGDVSAFSEEALEGAAQQMEARGIQQLIFDFERVDYVNSAGLSILIGIVTQVQEQGGRIAAVAVNTHYQKIFKMIGLTKFMDVHDTTAEVLKSWGVQ